MKKYILTLLFCLITTMAYCGVVAQVVSKDLDENGNIRVWVNYKLDGLDVPSRYPPINNLSVYCTRYSAPNFYNMTDTQIKDRILQDLNAQAENLIRQAYEKKNRNIQKQIYDNMNKNILNNHLNNLINSTVSKDTTTIKVDTTGSGQPDTIYTVKTDGSATIGK